MLDPINHGTKCIFTTTENSASSQLPQLLQAARSVEQQDVEISSSQETSFSDLVARPFDTENGGENYELNMNAQSPDSTSNSFDVVPLLHEQNIAGKYSS